AVTFFQDVGDRSRAAKMFRKVADDFPKSDHGQGAAELAALLGKMVDEDRSFREPPDANKLGIDARIKYDLHKLRDVHCYQMSQPGMCQVLSNCFAKGQEKEYNAAVDLWRIGRPAIPALLRLLDDRRPIRSVGYWRDYAHSRTVLRYQDAAIQILNELL